MAAFKVQGAIPYYRRDPVGHQISKSTVEGDVDVLQCKCSKGDLPVAIDKGPIWHMAVDEEDGDAPSKDPVHPRPVFVDKMDEDVYMELQDLVNDGVTHTIRAMVMAGLNGSMKEADAFRLQASTTITCFPQQGGSTCVLDWYDALKYSITFVNYYRRRHESGVMDDVPWICPMCKEKKLPQIKIQPRSW